MPHSYVDLVAGAADDDWLTTGEAAKLLGVSRQHIVDLCENGDLPCSTVGRHRRVRRADVENVRDLRHRMTADQLRSLMLAYAVAGHVVTDPETTVGRARRNLQHMRQADVRGSARLWLQEWERLLDGPLLELLNALTSPSLRSRELRQNTPFAGVLSDEERRQVLSTARVARKPVPA